MDSFEKKHLYRVELFAIFGPTLNFFAKNGSTTMKRMTYEEIKKKYPDQWVLIDELEVDDTLEVVSGVVIAHSPKRDVVDAVSIQKAGHLAIRFTGKIKGIFALNIL